MCRVPLRGRHDLTNAQWAKLEPLLPVGKNPGRPPVHTKRQLIDGIPWRTRAGTAWRDVPERYGPWQTVYQWSGPERCGSSSRSPAHRRAGGKTGTSVRRAGRPPPAAPSRARIRIAGTRTLWPVLRSRPGSRGELGKPVHGAPAVVPARSCSSCIANRYSAVCSRVASAALAAAAKHPRRSGGAGTSPCSVWHARRASASAVRPGHTMALLRYSGRTCSTARSAAKASTDAAAARSASNSPGATSSGSRWRAASMPAFSVAQTWSVTAATAPGSVRSSDQVPRPVRPPRSLPRPEAGSHTPRAARQPAEARNPRTPAPAGWLRRRPRPGARAPDPWCNRGRRQRHRASALPSSSTPRAG